jgi:hypothetical protein
MLKKAKATNTPTGTLGDGAVSRSSHHPLARREKERKRERESLFSKDGGGVFNDTQRINVGG